MSGSTYGDAGVRGQGRALSAVARHLGPTFSFPEDAEVLTRFGHYAGVLRVTDDFALAICTDGVGTKTVIASALDRYHTIGFDCVAMNVNDIVCVGARPLALVDYLGVHTLDGRRAEDVLRGLGDAAKEAGIAIPGGEIAQLPEIIGSDGHVRGDERAFDLVGTCIGILRPDRLMLGRKVAPGDVLIGVASSGIHSNGLTLARKVLLQRAGRRLDEHVPDLGRPLGDELLEPTEIYVRAALDLWAEGIDTHGLVHITGDGLLNLCRLEADVGYVVDSLPPSPPIFRLIQSDGDIDDAEMFRVFNMGIGMVAVVEARDEERALARLAASGYRASRIGKVVEDGARRVVLAEHGLAGTLDAEGFSAE